jgi:hypothetical protein
MEGCTTRHTAWELKFGPLSFELVLIYILEVGENNKFSQYSSSRRLLHLSWIHIWIQLHCKSSFFFFFPLIL